MPMEPNGVWHPGAHPDAHKDSLVERRIQLNPDGTVTKPFGKDDPALELLRSQNTKLKGQVERMRAALLAVCPEGIVDRIQKGE